MLAYLAACSACPSTSGEPDGADRPCTYVSCENECRAAGLCYGSCSGGTCHCAEACGPDAGGDVRRDDGDGAEADRPTDEGVDLPDARDDAEAADTSGCDYVASGETRPGASAGVTCRRISVPEVERLLLAFHGDGERIVFTGGSRPGVGPSLWLYSRSTGCTRLLQPGLSPDGRWASIGEPAIDGDAIAYRATWDPTPTSATCEMRLLDLGSGETRVLDESTSPDKPNGDCGCRMDYTVMDYPWIVWRDIREIDGLYRWYVIAINAETGERRNLSLDPPDGSRYWGAVRVDLIGTTVVWGGVGPDWARKVVAAELATEERWIVSEQPGDRYFATITPEWIAWIDHRAHPECGYLGPCSTDIYGYNRVTGVEQALVVAGDSMQGDEVDGEGPWLIYEDQRDGPSPTTDADREEDIYALHTSTMTEIRVTDWPGYEMIPRVYRREDATYGALLLEEISYGDAIYRLWDCDLPEPAGGSS